VIRVTRRLAATLQHLATLVVVVWDEPTASYVFPTDAEADQLSQFNGPTRDAALPRSLSDRRVRLSDHIAEAAAGRAAYLPLTETLPPARLEGALAFAASHDLPVAAIFYDAIPVLHPEWCPDPTIRQHHGAYMQLLSRCQVVFPISQFSADCLEQHWERAGIFGGT